MNELLQSRDELKRLTLMEGLFAAVERRGATRLVGCVVLLELALWFALELEPIYHAMPVLALGVIALMMRSESVPAWLYRVGLIGLREVEMLLVKSLAMLPNSDARIAALQSKMQKQGALRGCAAQARWLVRTLRIEHCQRLLCRPDYFACHLSRLAGVDLSKMESSTKLSLDQIVGRLAYVSMAWRMQQIGASVLVGGIIMGAYLNTMNSTWRWQGYPLVLGLLMISTVMLSRVRFYTPRYELTMGLYGLSQHRFVDFPGFVEKAASSLMRADGRGMGKVMRLLLLDQKLQASRS